MAIDVTDKWLTKDKRRTRLIEKIGEILTDGTALTIWRLAFDYYRDGEYIPHEQFDLIPNSGLFVEVGLAVRLENGVYVRGSKDLFKWYSNEINQRRDAGRKSAEVRRKNFGTAIPHNASNNPNRAPNGPDLSPNATQRNPNGAEREPNGAEPLIPVSGLNPNSAEEENSRARDGALPNDPPAGPAGDTPASAKANAIGGNAVLRGILGQDLNSNMARALREIPEEILVDWRARWTDDSIRKTAKKIVNKLIAKEGDFDKVNWRTRLTNCMEGETESLIVRPAPKLNSQDPPPEIFEKQPATPEEIAAAAKNAAKMGFRGTADMVAKLATQKAMPGKTA